MSDEKTLYARLGGYDAIAAVVDNLLPRLMSDEKLARFWAHRGEDGLRREKQLLIDFLCHCAGGPLFYTGRDMKTGSFGLLVAFLEKSSTMLRARFISLFGTRTFTAPTPPGDTYGAIVPINS